ncbi:mitotic checkpoint serine/threonine-protein kinase BUB1 isoform X2 [Esox lucius]|uniref:mitotic checkpoint serine/threonine-protein kinase BUB1 isoform X2 n=1 Tax=Esox lucius TaxID=8010 RepID=UPI001476D907|nr:mitotic checkpoint serine/threonine-protein kinase BUB1 isoform X2 [Esox lucius]
MDVRSNLQAFEESLRGYTGDDPLDPWDRYIQYLERVSSGQSWEMSMVLDRLVQRFLSEERYSNDPRYINYCIRCASYYKEPINLYSRIYSKGIGTRAAVLYVAWAQQFEQQGQLQQADNVYRSAMEKQAEPADTVLQEYRMFQSRMSSGGARAPEGVRNPLQNSHFVNQLHTHREPSPQCTDTEGLSQLPADKTIRIISRSEVAVVKKPSPDTLQTLSMYCKDDLLCEGSELCFEEVRAARFIAKRNQEEKRRKFEELQRLQDEVMDMKQVLEKLESNLSGSATFQERLASSLPVQRAPGTHATAVNSEPPSGRLRGENPSQGLSLHRPEAPVGHFQENTEGAKPSAPRACSLQASLVQPRPERNPKPFGLAARKSAAHGPEELQPSGVPRQGGVSQVSSVLCQHNGREQHETSVGEATESEVKLDLSQGATGNLSHVTPNTSLGLVQATPSRVLPSPTVNTREALDAIMDMFQAPNLLQEEHFPSSMSMHQTGKSFDAGYQATGNACPFSNPPSAIPFAIFRDENDDKENCGAAADNKIKPPMAPAGIPVSKTQKQNESQSELMPDESTMWGVRYNSLNSVAGCPDSTRDFALMAQLVSTPFQKKAPHSWDENGHHVGFGGPEEGPFLRQPTKLSPIIEQSPPEGLSETGIEGSMRAQGFAEQGTIVGEGLAQRSLATCSITEVQHHAPTALSFRDQTASLVHTEGAVAKSPPSKSSKPDWNVYVSPEKPVLQSAGPLALCAPVAEALVSKCQIPGPDVPTSTVKAPMSAFDTPVSPESASLFDWLVIKSTEVMVEPQLDAFMSSRPVQTTDGYPPKTTDIPMSPEPAKFGLDFDMSPLRSSSLRMDIPQSPAALKGRYNRDISMSPGHGSKVNVDVPMSPDHGSKANVDVPMSPDHGSKVNMDVPMSPAAQGAVAAKPVSNPWDEELILSLLSRLPTPLDSLPNFITWGCKVPNIAPKMNIQMGDGSLWVNCVLGQGAFATVYQAIDLTTSEKMILKVQKPANPWEFYINTQLNTRMPPNVRHLFSNIHSAHLFQNGSVLLGELHGCGTLLNAVNLYKNMSDKVMPQPLVLYFTVCILHMVEQLHHAHIIHADIKPDNFLLGERFLENKSFDPDTLDHGLALIDLGQSIDMTLFPEGTAFTAKCLTSGFQCTEMQSGRPWTYQTDYFGIAGTVYCMIFGTYMQVTREDGVWKTNAVFRRNPLSEVWTEFFHTLLNVPDCQSLLCLRSLRSRLSSVLQTNYSSKLSSLKTRLVIQLLESRSARR